MASFDRCRSRLDLLSEWLFRITSSRYALRATRIMSRKGVKYRSSWMLHDENIENVEHVSLDPKVQRELGCSVGEHVFLEYPWAYVSREAVLRFANNADSSLQLYRDRIKAYGGDTFLVGYSSTELIDRKFVICLTEDARSTIVRRNADISKKIRSEVIRKIKKTGKSWKSLGSETALDESLIRSTREFFEVEVYLPIKSLGLNRQLSDRSSEGSWDSYVELIPYERFENVERKRVSKMIQTHFEPREIGVQTYPGYPKNAWTQYCYEDTLGLQDDNVESEEEETKAEEKESAGEKSEKESEEKKTTEGSKEVSEIDTEQKPVEKTPLELFLENRAQEMIEAVCYNTVVNVYVDDIETLAKRDFEITRPRDEIACAERFSLIDLSFTAGKVISDVSWHPGLVEYVAASYIITPSREIARFSSKRDVVSKPEPTVLLWSLADSLRPQLSLWCHQEIYCVSFCPMNADFIIGGSASGQIIVWNIHGQIEARDVEDTVSITSAFVVSDQDYSHELPIRRIQWLPDNYRIEPSGKLTKLSTSSSCQFLTISEDGIVAIWDLLRYSVTSQLKPNDRENLNGIFRPTYRLNVRPSENPFFTPLHLCLPSIDAFQESDRRNELDSTDVDCTKRLWIGTAQGHFACCTWEGQVFDVETSVLEECKLLNCSSAHDGPVATILRSPHLSDVLLTMGGHVFAIWKDDYLDLPLFRRKSDCVYTACCWGNRPGIFVMGTSLGNLEVWDIKRWANKPVITQTISRKPITLLSLQESCKYDTKLFGAGDYNSAFRIFEESKEFEDDLLERMDWFEEYIWREVRRKKIFSSWQKDFLQNDTTAIARRQARANEEHRLKLEMARLKLHREHEERLRLEAEKEERKKPKSKDTVWKLHQQKRMKKVLLEKKKFLPRELEEKRLPLVRLAEERNAKMIKAKNEVTLRDKHFDKFMSLKFPEYYDCVEKDKILEERREPVKDEEIDVYLEEFYKIRDEARKMIVEKLHFPKFDWNTCAKKGKERLQNVNNL
ncbi:WD repeat-containing protein 63 [Trachymyrmex septentrionalis]|uniref:WD repeat-containing protein 63 n=1 Tax=Trachymyrmex septentrionalis TaxID=34720 RepID=A0A195FGN7_9HYME|nr:PREDICTED: WD repeat-containing protein 63-like [Trachymyrmex septentrionalis]KYN39845.1 WD repeat-containing protein 63 [Trachymyrmex septentrionalis]